MDVVSEANSQLVGAWRLFTQSFPAKDHGDLPGLSLAWGEVPYFAHNAIAVSTPAVCQKDWDGRAKGALAYMSKKRFGGIFMVCDDWVPKEVTRGMDFHLAWEMTGMAASCLLAPVKAMAELDIRRVADRKTLLDLYDLNSAGYGMDPEPGRASIGSLEDWERSTFGFVGYQLGDPVSCAAVFPLDGRLYVGMVATHPRAQRRGYAETVLRHALKQAERATGLCRTVLHASDAGRSLYQRLGYQATSHFTVYTPSGEMRPRL